MKIIQGDCVEVMREMEDESVDAVVCDPPYGLEFMGREWDKLDSFRPDTAPSGIAHKVPDSTPRWSRIPHHAMTAMQSWHLTWTREAFRVLKPGGHLVAFGGTRTYHRLACAIEDAGFEIRDSLHWVYGSGFPKGHRVDIAIDKHLYDGDGPLPDMCDLPRTPEGAKWEGYNVALKPSHEPIVLARKPLIGTVAENVLTHGTGALNVDGCRISTGDNLSGGAYAKDGSERHDGIENWRYKRDGGAGEYQQPSGRWPPNCVFSHHPDCADDCHPSCPIRELGEQSGESTSVAAPRGGQGFHNCLGRPDRPRLDGQSVAGHADHGTAARFFPCFKYNAKSSTAERGLGLPDGERNTHPTVKPVDLMRWLVRLVTPPCGTVLDPFLGSGTTALACALEGVECVGIERDEGYVEKARKRVAWAEAHVRKYGRPPIDMGTVEAAAREKDEDPKQVSLFGED